MVKARVSLNDFPNGAEAPNRVYRPKEKKRPPSHERKTSRRWSDAQRKRFAATMKKVWKKKKADREKEYKVTPAAK